VKTELYPSAIGPVRLTERDTLFIWAPFEVTRSSEHRYVVEIEWLWHFRRPYSSSSPYSSNKWGFAQFGPFDLRRRAS
jgi:hypothetical protein